MHRVKITSARARPLGRREAIAWLLGTAAAPGLRAQPAPALMPLVDAHVHYSHDAVELVPPAQAAALLREAGLKGALVSSSDDRGTQLLLQAAPEIVLPELRPYRTRADTGTWVREAAVAQYMEQRLARYRYVGIGEFHLFGDDALLPVPRRMVAMAREHGLVLHAHSDVAAVEHLFQLWPQARVLWAHSGFERPEAVREVLRRHPQLWCDLAYRSDHAQVSAGASPTGRVDAAWREAFTEFPDRFCVGSDTFTPERWHYIGPHAAWSRAWLADLPRPLAENIAWRNATALLRAAPRS